MKLEYIAEHWEIIVVIGAVVMRELTKNMAKQTATKLIEHFLSPQTKDIREIKHNLKIFMDAKGVKGEWSESGEGLISYAKVRRSLSRSFATFSKVIFRRICRYQRRKRKMNNINWVTLIPALLGALKLILQPFGIVIEDQSINEITNGAAAILTVVGVIMSHTKGGAVNAQSYISADPRK
jgi:uncharacterized membrane protein